MKYERIRNLREDNDLTQIKLAGELYISPRTYARYEHGDRNIPPEVLIEISNYYGVSIDYLLGCTDNPVRNL